MSVLTRLRGPWFAPPDTPYSIREIAVDDDTTARSLTVRSILAPRRFAVGGAILSMLHQVGEALVPVLAGLTIDNAIRAGDGGQLALWLVLLALDFALLSYAYRFGSRLAQSAMEAVRQQLRVRVAARLLDSRGSTGGDRLPGVALSITNSDVDRLSIAVALGVYPPGQIAAIVVGGAILLSISWPLGLFVLIGVPLLVIALDRSGEPLRRRSDAEQELAATAAGQAADLMSGYRIVKGMRGERAAEGRYGQVSQQALGAAEQARGAYGGYLGLASIATGLFLAVVGTTAGLLTVNGSMTIAELVTVAGLTQFLMSPVGSLATYVGMLWSRGLASAGRILTVLQEPPRHAGSGQPRDSDEPGVLELSGVLGDGRSGLSLRVEPGEFVVVRGDSAAAAELFGVLAARRSRDAQVEYDGVGYAELDPQWRRGHVLAAAHEAGLFPGSILDNVDLGRASRERALAALDAAGCRELIDGLPDGVATAIGEDGIGLSGGQRQRVALARAIAADPPVLVLHDPTTAVDSVTEAQIALQLKEVRRGRTTVVITDAPAFRAVADRVVELAMSEVGR
ncbi:ATP-binding cassette domain-containing protein [Epidermidibacterium keratini]|uniref:ATP-binding cassette domain-containing protein n=1 Tax=Epidermidibacterium keratini TaxID=1891644 RepID=A0A7L4YP64_9ACTN|nr:ABC transporter ATP-binding protein [Epidermidibacterium keratini]QHC00822.1 ATP-binding cassette domain-containing protein [Epidermidibacterium keratini]